MKSLTLTALIALTSLFSYSQPETEIYLFDLKKTASSYELENPVHVTKGNPGYDNQPHFSLDGSKLYYASTRNDQTDIVEFSLASQSIRWVNATPGSEYSPTPLPGDGYLSSISLEKDGTQLLYKYAISDGNREILVPDLKIGYHAWYNEKVIVTFVLGEVPTLQACYLQEKRNHILQKYPGRSIHNIPNSKLISYVNKETLPWVIRSLHPITGATKDLTETLEGSEDMAWTAHGDIIMGRDSKLYVYSIDKKTKWLEIADLSEHGLKEITRLAVNSKGNKIAIVVGE